MNDKNALLAEALAVFDFMLEGCSLQSFGDFQNGNGETVGPRMDVVHEKLRLALSAPSVDAQPVAWRSGEKEPFDLFMVWAKESLGQGYSLEMDDHTFTDPVTRWAFNGFKAGLRHPSTTTAPASERFAELLRCQREQAKTKAGDPYMAGLYNGMSMMCANFDNATEWECLPTAAQVAASKAPVTVPEWQPIATAPKNMPRSYLVANEKGQVAPKIDGIIRNCTGSNWDWHYGEAITHYMPMPAPPAMNNLAAPTTDGCE